ncbi:MAG: energy transducer TonB [Candidatus Omnitrophota bacterium]
MIQNKNITLLAFAGSLVGHIFILGGVYYPIKNLSKEKNKNINIQIAINKAELIPDIRQIDNEIKLKEIKSVQNKNVLQKSQEFSESNKGLETYDKSIVKKTSSDERIKVINHKNEAMLRYQDTVKRKIQQAKRYPDWAKKQEIEGVVYISFIILSDGRVSDVQLKKSSGFDILDNEAIATVNRASPFLPIPKDIDSSYVEMSVYIVFKLTG